MKPGHHALNLSWGAVTGKLPKRDYPYEVAHMLATLKLMGYDFHECPRDHLAEGQLILFGHDIYKVAEIRGDAGAATLVGPL